MYMRLHVFTLRSVFASPLLAASLAGITADLSAQAKVFNACYVPLTGTVYRIKEPDVKQTCSSTSHIEFTWTDGMGAIRTGDAAGGDLSGLFPNPTVAKLLGRALSTTPPAAGQVLTFDGSAWVPVTPTGGGGTSDHGALTGLGDDDHPQYLLTNGMRNATNGFAVTGTFGVGTIPLQVSGTLPPALMWYPGKAAFRAGQALGNQWDDANTGAHSVAMGLNTQASGQHSIALGSFSTASGTHTTAIGHNSTAGGFGTVALGLHATASSTASVAIGSHVIASGFHSTAIGTNVVASGNNSFAIGTNVSTNGNFGTFMYGDASTGTTMVAGGDNEFLVRAAGGVYLYSNSGLTSGVQLLPGAGAWATISDVKRKHLFRDEDAETALAKIAAMPIRSWSYKSQDPSIRHLGPTAQDFYSAFRLGGSDTTITTTDIDGVTLLAVKGLEQRSSAQAREIEAIRAENALLREKLRDLDALRAELADLRARFERLERERNER